MSARALKQSGISIRISEIFLSLQGESTTSGLPTVFLRTTGCPLRCAYCDTSYAFSGGQLMDLDEILEKTAAYQVQHVTVTGGEPLAQPATYDLLQRLCDAGYRVSLETSGAIDISPVDCRVMKVVDIKTPGSGECDRNLWSNLAHLAPPDQLKFVITDRTDYEWSRDRLGSLAEGIEILFSASHDQLAARQLADWIVQDRLPVRFQLQLHKYLWGNEPGR